MRTFLSADPAMKKAVCLFTVKNLNRYKLSPVSDPKLLWTIFGSTKMKGALAEPCLDDDEDEDEEEPEEAPLASCMFLPPVLPPKCLVKFISAGTLADARVAKKNNT